VIVPGQSVRIVVATRPVDFRKGHDGLAAVVQDQLGFDPHSGLVVIFRSRRGDRTKILFWDGSGLVMVYKRLEQGSFTWPAVEDGVMRLSRAQFEALVEGLDWRRVMARRVPRPAAAE
jgi:transposase